MTEWAVEKLHQIIHEEFEITRKLLVDLYNNKKERENAGDKGTGTRVGRKVRTTDNSVGTKEI